MAMCSRLISAITICGITCHSSLVLAATTGTPPAGAATTKQAPEKSKPNTEKNTALPTRIKRAGKASPPLLLKPDTPKLVGPDGKAVIPDKPPGAAPDFERFPTVGKFEILMFGNSTPSLPIESRLDKLELSVFQSTFPHIDIEQRIAHLKSLLLGQENNRERTALPNPALPQLAQPQQAPTGTNPTGANPTGANPTGVNTTGVNPPGTASTETTPPGVPTATAPNYGLDEEPLLETAPKGQDTFSRKQIYSESELAEELPQLELEKFALALLNEERASRGLSALHWDNEVSKMAQHHVAELSQRGLVSHYNKEGENPDLRWTKRGGAGMLEEGLVQLSNPTVRKANKGVIVQLMDILASRQDDREALFSPHATNFAAAYAWSPDKNRLIFCTATVTDRANMHTVPHTAKLGEKLELKGEIHEPYKFARISVAWEGHDNKPADGIDDSDEPMPYFPPLDYIAYAEHSERDWQKTITVLQIAGITAAIAGGFFMPPVALAAPLIAAGGMATINPRPLSDIPVKGGVKTHGRNFSHKVPLSHNGKNGIYYITIWAKDGINENPVPISRRALVVTGNTDDKQKKPEEPIAHDSGATSTAQEGSAGSREIEHSLSEEPLTSAPTALSPAAGELSAGKTSTPDIGLPTTASDNPGDLNKQPIEESQNVPNQ